MTNSSWRSAGGLLLLAMGAALTTTARAADATIALPADACAGLQGFAIPASAIGLPTGGATVQTAVHVAATEDKNVNGDFCKATGTIKPSSSSTKVFEFQVNLPTSWNGRALQMGGGGYDGSLVTGLGAYTLQPAGADSPLKQGYVTLGSNGGHKGGAGFDGTFGTDDEALADYGKMSVKKTHDVAVAIVKKAYGRAPQRFYFIGGSQGGHEALDAAARYPEDYDGVVAHYPAYDVTLLHLGSFNVGKALFANGGAGWIDAKHLKLLTDAVYAKCDDLDGAKDGIISNVASCNKAFDPKTLRCANGAAGDSCLSDAQLAAVATITSEYKPGVTIAGLDAFPKWALLEGATFAGPSNFGGAANPGAQNPLLYTAGDQTIKYIITRDPKFDPMTFDPKKYEKDIARAASMMDVSDVSLEKFRAKGGKIIMTHGTADDFITPHNSVAYYKRQVAQFGQQRLDSFMRFYLIPGLGHGFGTFNAKFDSLGALQTWVENGKAPTGLTAVDGNPNANRSRPLCEYPKWPKFTGAAGTDGSAASFTCVAS
jgi:feruloyl esterase